jgi:hypothetical protein
MESRGIVNRTVEFARPERIAGSMPSSYWKDFVHAGYRLSGHDAQWQDAGDGRQEYVDTQDAAKIEADAKAMVKKLGKPDGGFIAGYYGGNEAIGLDPKWKRLACEALTHYGTYGADS